MPAPDPRRPVPSHPPGCLGCEMGVRLRTDGRSVVGEVTFDSRYEGAFGIAHGGAVSVALDEALGSLAMVLRERPMVTASLKVAFTRPPLLCRRLELAAWPESVNGRRLRLAAELRDGGEVVARATALIVEVSDTHFATSATSLRWWRERLPS